MHVEKLVNFYSIPREKKSAFLFLKSIGLILLFLVYFVGIAHGKNYFQQALSYQLVVHLSDTENELFANETIEYQNNSSDTLAEIYFHLWPNAYKNDETAMAKQLLENGETQFYYSSENKRGYIDGLKFSVNQQAAVFELDKSFIDIGKLILNEPLLPGQSITINTPFHVKLPSAEISRLGYLGQSYMISQWYPKPAVYDQKGWHTMPYLTEGEFYSEFANFDVKITLPKNYVVGASGTLNDSTELSWLTKKAAEVDTTNSFDTSFPNSDTSLKTLHYTANNVHDFAWFADKRYHVIKNEFELPISKRKITSWTFYTNSQPKLWKKVPEYIKSAILAFSEYLGEYPFDQITVVDGTIAAGAGMEYPMITVVGNAGSAFEMEYTLIHEIGHNWFYGILGSNERDAAWMDEGMNSYFNLRYFEQKYPAKNFAELHSSKRAVKFARLNNYSHKTEYVLQYLALARKKMDQAGSLTTADYTPMNYSAIVYEKTAFCFHYLSTYLGKSLFDSLMHEYYETWKFKHPQPEDLKAIFAKGSEQNLDWFFDDLLTSTKTIDYKIKSIKEQDSVYVLKIKNRGEIAGPFSITAVKNKQPIVSKWYPGVTKKATLTFPKASCNFLEIDNPWNMPEISRRNNVIRTQGLFKKVEPFRFQFIGTIDNSQKTIVNYFPAVGFTAHDNFMAGMTFYNYTLMQKPFEYLIMPLYSIKNENLVGALKFSYHNNSRGVLQAIEPQLSIKKYSYRSVPFNLEYLKFAPALTIAVRKKTPRSSIQQKIKLRSITILEDEAIYSASQKEYQLKKYSNRYTINQATYLIANKRTINPFEFSLQVEQGKNFMKSALEASYHVSYKRRSKSADIRLFAGKFIYQNNVNSYFGFSMNANNDYLYDNIYLGRNEIQAFYNQQVYMKDASFKNLTLTPNSKDWLLAMNILLPAPDKIPLAFYADFGKSTTSATLDYDCGVALIILKNCLEVYVPIKQSSDLNQLKFAEKIRFVLHFNNLNPIEQLKSSFN
jgi:hypothetical protein